ncbi:MAG: lipoprotein [Rhizobium sp.]|nr:lipoprotein [Rhizobium sp.]MBW8445164.1 lipoprotein [Arenimonas sp.]
MVKTLSRWTMAAGLLATALVLSGCGRKADLDPPSMPAEQQNKLATPGEKPEKPSVPDKPFILDPLL